MFKRDLILKTIIKDQSLFLLGPRQSGKTTLIQSQFPEAQIIDLLDPEVFRDLNKSPNLIKDLILTKDDSIVVVDEIQKLPELLDVVQSLIVKHETLHFILTGSSARKLRKQGQNLLGGRAYPLFLHPITSHEFQTYYPEKNLNELILKGGLPKVLTSKNPFNRLKAYVGVYLQEEIKAEGFSRNLSDFSKFLDVAALTNAEQLDYSNIANDVQISPRTVASYYLILQDTLIGYLLESFKETKTRKAVTTPKFYFFDTGVCNHIVGRQQLAEGTPEYGKALEHFIFTELLAFRDYCFKQFEIYYWRSTSKFEVDFIIKLRNKKLIGIEVKATNRVDKDDLKGLKAFEEDFKLSQKIIISNEKHSRLIDGGFIVLPSAVFCKQLWNMELF